MSTTAIRLELLTDKKIEKYIRLGFYGPVARQRLLETSRRKKPAGKKRTGPLSPTLDILDAVIKTP